MNTKSMQITRTSKTTGEINTFTLEDAVDQFIKDNHAYAEIEDDVEAYLNDMSTVFETRNMLENMDAPIDAGNYIYSN